MKNRDDLLRQALDSLKFAFAELKGKIPHEDAYMINKRIRLIVSELAKGDQ